MFHVGQKVVCVDDGGYKYLKLNSIYVVEKVFKSKECGDSFMLWLVGVADENKPRFGGYYATRFRPLVEKKTDISIFTAMLKDVKQP